MWLLYKWFVLALYFFFSSHQVLKSCDAHSNEYVNRLKDEPKVVAILEKGQKLLEAKNAPASDMCRIYLKRIEHIYFKFDPKVVQQKNVSESTIAACWSNRI